MSIYTQSQVGEACDVPPSTVGYATLKGWISGPSLAVGRRKFFTQAEFEAAVEFFRQKEALKNAGHKEGD